MLSLLAVHFSNSCRKSADNQRSPWFIPVCLAFYLMIPASVFAKQTLVLNTAFSYPLSTDAQTGFVDELVRHALLLIGYDEESVQLPAERALINANSGLDDGDLLRIGGLQKTYPNLVQVPEKIIDIEFVIFTKQKDLPIVQWSDLNPYSVAIITGWKILERNISPAVELTKVKNVEQLFTMLLKDRVDVLVFSRWVGLGYLKQHNIRGVNVLTPSLAQRGMYVYLHKKHQQLVPKLAEVLRAMKTDGSYQKIYNKTLTPLE